MPEDIENFAQASKHIRSISGPRLMEHRRLMRKYTSFSGPAAADTVEPLLKDVLADPHIGYYVKEIDLCRVREGDAEDQDEDAREGKEEGEQESVVEGEQRMEWKMGAWKKESTNPRGMQASTTFMLLFTKASC